MPNLLPEEAPYVGDGPRSLAQWTTFVASNAGSGLRQAIENEAAAQGVFCPAAFVDGMLRAVEEQFLA